MHLNTKMVLCCALFVMISAAALVGALIGNISC